MFRGRPQLERMWDTRFKDKLDQVAEDIFVPLVYTSRVTCDEKITCKTLATIFIRLY